ncbi:hypothetical protein EV193_101842 [Herbihabitans rhizosphaerae]|uniref:YggT family protein n=1 Tax=Herbihabitans rhizosphaerae TaxID=1872711 RepID=A0A4Q7L8H7_9PSEU|nr:hypothetical protein [Herbihabitans rhizosphaerae]RZS44961.1 hypothetical protein EV193_101842 [Herbihabitans rhizosphaerae]
MAGRVVLAIGGLFALIEALYILLILFGANPVNSFFSFVKSLAEPLALFFPGLIPIDNYDVAVLVNYGLAGLFWLLVAGVVARIVF